MDQLYGYPDNAIAQVRKQKLWCADAKYFKKVKISPSATIKMLSHGQQGVEKGVSKSGKPIEVMGLLLGRPDNLDPTSIVISDALPLPIEGFETRVVADDENVINYMIELGESMELTRKEKFCGWYHTHPFDLDGTSHCFLSNTDITTQLQWQRSEDPHGNPWLAIVIDPLYSLDKGKPEMMAFRVYPPEYSPPANETPDGKLIKEDRIRVEKWGACWNRYYQLPIEYFMSNLAKNSLNQLSNKFLWEKPLVTTPLSTNEQLNDEINSIKSIDNKIHRLKFRKGNNNNPSSSIASSYRGGGAVAGYEEDVSAPTGMSVPPEAFEYTASLVPSEKESKGLKVATGVSNDVATEHLCRICSQLTKKLIFCSRDLQSLASPDSEKMDVTMN